MGLGMRLGIIVIAHLAPDLVFRKWRAQMLVKGEEEREGMEE